MAIRLRNLSQCSTCCDMLLGVWLSWTMNQKYLATKWQDLKSLWIATQNISYSKWQLKKECKSHIYLKIFFSQIQFNTQLHKLVCHVKLEVVVVVILTQDSYFRFLDWCGPQNLKIIQKDTNYSLAFHTVLYTAWLLKIITQRSVENHPPT